MSLELPKGMLLDLDDTIIAFDVLTEECWMRTANEFSDLVESYGITDLKGSIITKANWFWSDRERHGEWRGELVESRRRIVILVLSDYGINDVDLSNRIADRYSELKEEMLYVFPGAKETLNKLKESEFRLALITNGSSKFQRHKLENFGLSDLFDIILIEGEQGVGRPFIEIYEIALEALKLKAKDVWMIGDNLEWDVVAPQSIGIRGMWINNKKLSPPDGTKPFLTIPKLTEIERYLFH